MPEMLLDSRSIFDSKKIALAQWLRQNLAPVRVLSNDDLHVYNSKKFIVGWAVNVSHKGPVRFFHILIDAQFPYSPIRIAYKSEEVYLKWPHVEQCGLLCLPESPNVIASVEEAIYVSLTNALTLVDQCQNPQFVENELRFEFISYWNRSRHRDANPIRSLLDPTNHAPRRIAIWYGDDFILVGETSEHVSSWLRNLGRKEESRVETGVFGYLKQAPVPPFPDTPKQLFALLKGSCPGIDRVLEGHPAAKDATVILAASSPTGDGLISLRLNAPNLNGFRKKKQLRLSAKKQLWSIRSGLTRSEVKRYDSSWIHGRGLDNRHAIIQQANVMVLGCGSLGSQVAVRLAQAGVGKLTIIDPDLLEAANVGRHALGISSVGQYKATELAKVISLRFPHMRGIEGYPQTWQQHFDIDPNIFAGVDLIVACLGEWSADGPLGEWQTRQGSACPIVYGWLDEQGTASHGLALITEGPALSCILDAEGRLRIPETLWETDGRIQAEPACGNFFQPYGPIDVAHAESLVSRLCLDVLIKRASLPVHRIYAGATAQLIESGGEWSPEHFKYRPHAYEGPFEYERPVSYCGVCQTCLDIS